MLHTVNEEQFKELLKKRQLKEQRKLAKSGIGSALEGKQIVTVGDYDRDYINWKHFIVGQIFRLGIHEFCAKTRQNANEIAEEIITSDDDTKWLSLAINYFDAMESDC